MRKGSTHITSLSLTEENFTAFFNDYYSSFCFFANRYVNDPLIAEDIVADVALKVWEKREEIRNSSSLKTYFYVSIRNTCMNWLNNEKKRLNKSATYHAIKQQEQQTILEHIIRTETLHQLECAVHTLPSQCKKVFIKLFFEGKSLSETAEEMQLSLSTIKAQRQRGIKLLRKQFSTATVILMAFLLI